MLCFNFTQNGRGCCQLQSGRADILGEQVESASSTSTMCFCGFVFRTINFIKHFVNIACAINSPWQIFSRFWPLQRFKYSCRSPFRSSLRRDLLEWEPFFIILSVFSLPSPSVLSSPPHPSLPPADGGDVAARSAAEHEESGDVGGLCYRGDGDHPSAPNRQAEESSAPGPQSQGDLLMGVYGNQKWAKGVAQFPNCGQNSTKKGMEPFQILIVCFKLHDWFYPLSCSYTMCNTSF